MKFITTGKEFHSKQSDGFRRLYGKKRVVMTEYNLKRAYDAESPDDGFRVYVDKFWPRGLSREDFNYNLWDKDIAPSTELREWFHADPDGRWAEFERKYMAELKANPAFEALKKLLATKAVVTLIYSSRNERENNAVVVYHALDPDYENIS